jgi:hypothetical protein
MRSARRLLVIAAFDLDAARVNSPVSTKWLRTIAWDLLVDRSPGSSMNGPSSATVIIKRFIIAFGNRLLAPNLCLEVRSPVDARHHPKCVEREVRLAG